MSNSRSPSRSGSGLSLFDMQLQPKANTAYELTLTNIKWTAN